MHYPGCNASLGIGVRYQFFNSSEGVGVQYQWCNSSVGVGVQYEWCSSSVGVKNLFGSAVTSLFGPSILAVRTLSLVRILYLIIHDMLSENVNHSLIYFHQQDLCPSQALVMTSPLNAGHSGSSVWYMTNKSDSRVAHTGQYVVNSC